MKIIISILILISLSFGEVKFYQLTLYEVPGRNLYRDARSLLYFVLENCDETATWDECTYRYDDDRLGVSFVTFPSGRSYRVRSVYK